MNKTYTALIEENGIKIYLYHAVLVDVKKNASAFDFERLVGDGTVGQPGPRNEPTGDFPPLPPRGQRRGNCA